MTEPKNKSISRRNLVRGLGAMGAVGAAGLVSACSKPEQSADCKDSGGAADQGKRRLKMVTTWPKNFPGLFTGAERFTDRIRVMTDGRIDITIYGAGELVGALGAFDAVSEGKADLYHGAEYYWQGKAAAFPFFCALPMGMTCNEINAWIYFGGGQQLWDELSGRYNIKPMLCGNTGTQMGGWFKEPVNSVDDIQGLKVRMPGLGGEVFRRLGATPVTMPGGELFQALSQSTIDATEWVGPWNDLAMGFHSITKNYYTSGIQEPGAALSVGFNKDIWDSFSAKDQAIINAAAAEENSMMYSEYNAKNAAALKVLVDDHGVELLQFNDEIRAKLAEISYEVVAEVAEQDELSKRIFDSYQKSKASGMTWGAVAEDYFTASRRQFPES